MTLTGNLCGVVGGWLVVVMGTISGVVCGASL